MKKFIALFCVLFALPASAEIFSYTAKVKELENGEVRYCAKVQVATVGHTYINRTKCRTLDAWKAMGYEVSTVDGEPL
jgi:hypothetical protein